MCRQNGCNTDSDCQGASDCSLDIARSTGAGRLDDFVVEDPAGVHAAKVARDIRPIMERHAAARRGSAPPRLVLHSGAPTVVDVDNGRKIPCDLSALDSLIGVEAQVEPQSQKEMNR